jgi:hypothetical protein
VLLAPGLAAAAPAAGAAPPAASLPKEGERGPWSSSRGASPVPVPEAGTLGRGFYRNAYFGIQLPLPPGWRQKPGWPPPSDYGYYVLAQLVPPNNSAKGPSSVLIAAQDMFFSPAPAASAAELLGHMQAQLPVDFSVDQTPADTRIGPRTFSRLAYSAPAVHQHWLVLATQIRCHIVELVISGHDPAQLRTLGAQLGRIAALPGAPAPVCTDGYATGEHILSRVEPALPTRHYNRIPVRLIIDPQGQVAHVHLLSAYAEQMRPLADALMRWRFKPYTVRGRPVAVETAALFGHPRQD